MLNLHAHSYYSYKKSINSIEDIAEKASQDGNKAFCITDINSLTSFIKAFAYAKKTGMKFIPGCEFLIRPEDGVNKELIQKQINFFKKEIPLKRTTPEMAAEYQKQMEALSHVDAVYCHSLVLIAYNNQGFKNLTNIFCNQKDEYETDCYLSTWEDIERYSDGLICLSGGVYGETSYYLKHGLVEKAQEVAERCRKIFKNRYFLEMQNQDPQKDDTKALAQKMNIRTVSTNFVSYIQSEDKMKYRLFRNAMDQSVKFFEDESAQTELNDSSIQWIIDLCMMEEIETPKAEPLKDCNDDLREICMKGWEKLRKGTEREQESLERLEYELSVIKLKNFSEYFIKVIQIIEVAHDLKILVGPGRGSGCGSELCYLSGITDVDPLQYDLYFERFLNPERNGFPDIDIDFAAATEDDEDQASRNKIVDELIRREIFKFAGFINNEVRTSTLVMFKKAASYFELPYEEANKISTSEIYKEKLNEKEYTGWLHQAVDDFGLDWEDFWELMESKMQYCYELDKIPYNSSTAASGVIMSDADDVFLPVRNGFIGYNGSDLESWGYIKYDLLSITSFILLQKIEGTQIDWNDNGDDQVWNVISQGDTDFVFQFSSNGMRHILTSVKPHDINTLAEINALFRPGPLEMIDKYIALKNGDTSGLTEEDRLLYGLLKEIFGENHCGLVIFQEDVMKVCQMGAGFSLAETDDIRKAMSKKKHDLLEQYGKRFIKDWKLGGDPNKIWEQLKKFGSYAFNKSHAVAYSIIAYQTAKIWLYHRDQVLEYKLNYEKDEKYQAAISKCKQLNMKFVYPSFENLSNTETKIQDSKIIMPGMCEKQYSSYVDFLFGEDKVNILIYKGVCDHLTQDREALAELSSSLPKKEREKALFMEPRGETFTTLEQILNGLQSAGSIEYQKDDMGNWVVLMHRLRSKDLEIVFHPFHSYETKRQICKWDLKYFGSVRNNILSDLPYINTLGIESTLNRMKERLIQRGMEKRVYRDMKEELEDFMREFYSREEKKTFPHVFALYKDHIAYERSTKVFFTFNDRSDFFYVSGHMAKMVQTLKKNTLLDLTLIFSPFINKRREEFVYDFDVESMEVVEGDLCL